MQEATNVFAPIALELPSVANGRSLYADTLSHLRVGRVPGGPTLRQGPSPGRALYQGAGPKSANTGNSDFQQSEVRLSHIHNLRVWKDGSHKRFVEGDLVFTARTGDRQTDPINAMELHVMNSVLRHGWNTAMREFDKPIASLLDAEADYEDGESERSFGGLTLAQLFARNEVWLPSDTQLALVDVYSPHAGNRNTNRLVGLRREHVSRTPAPNVVDAVAAEAKALSFKPAHEANGRAERRRAVQQDARRKHDLSNALLAVRRRRPDLFDHTTAEGIRRTYNFLGIMLNSAPSSVNGESVHANVVYKNGTDARNRWGNELNVGAHLFLVLHRTRTATGAPGPFQWVPYADNARKAPPPGMLEHIGLSGHLEAGTSNFVFVGTLREPLYSRRSDVTRLRSVGLHANWQTDCGTGPVSIDDARAATMSLDLITVGVRI